MAEAGVAMTVVTGRDAYIVLERRQIYWTMYGRQTKVHLARGRPDQPLNNYRWIYTLCGIGINPLIDGVKVQELPSGERVHPMSCKNCLRIEAGIERRQHDH